MLVFEIISLFLHRRIHLFWKIYWAMGIMFGINLTYAIQPSPMGWRRRLFIFNTNFIGRDTVAMVLSNNIFVAHGLQNDWK